MDTHVSQRGSTVAVMREILEVFDEAGVEVTVDALEPWSFLETTSSAG